VTVADDEVVVLGEEGQRDQKQKRELHSVTIPLL
jgi:hypothetical protein